MNMIMTICIDKLLVLPADFVNDEILCDIGHQTSSEDKTKDNWFQSN